MTPETLTEVEALIQRNQAAIEGLRRLYGFSDSEAIYFMGQGEEGQDRSADERSLTCNK